MKRKGTYVLVIALGGDMEIRVGALGTLHFEKGEYCYAGSAMGGLDQRLSRHLAKEKTIRWHIDNLTTVADSVKAYISYPDFIPECDLARFAEESGMIPVHKGFGCSDCDCDTHLFLIVKGSLQAFLDRTGMVPYRLLYGY